MNLLEHASCEALARQNASAVPPSLFETALAHPVFAVNGPSLSRHARELAGHVLADPDRLGRTQCLFLSALAEAVKDSGLSRKKLATMRVGVAIGTTVGATFTDHEGYFSWKNRGVPNPGGVADFLGGNLARLAHAVLGTRGPASVVVNACSSGTDTLGLALNWLRQGVCDLCIAGGADALSIIPYHGFASLQLLDQKPCRPFDAERGGLTLGEGAACVVLEPAMRRDASDKHLTGRLLGYGAASDAWHPTAPHPRGRGLVAAVKNALDDAGLTPDDISLVNAHGTGTQANDKAECAAIREVFGNSPPPVVSTKGATGHTLGAAGAVEVILTLLALGSGEVHGTTGCGRQDPSLEAPVLTSSDRVALRGAVGISQSLAFGGGNSALVLEAVRGMEAARE